MTRVPPRAAPPLGAPTAEAAPPRPWYVSALFALLALTLLLGGSWLYARVRTPYPFFGTAYPNPPAAAPLTGLAPDGQETTFTPGQGKVTALFFGFTNCPNICPVTLAYLNKARAALSPAEGERFQILLVSVDPERDSPKKLGEYLDYFGGGLALNIPEPRLSEAARAYGVGYQKVDLKSPGEYQINHTTATYLIDASGRLRVLWDYTQLGETERVVRDLRYVLEHPSS